MKITPAMHQYYDIKEQYSDALLFFRMGDFYEMFEKDAEIAHKILGITLTTRNKNAENPIKLAGIPYHAKNKYLPILVKAGYKVAIAEQVSDPKLKGIVEREVTRVITPSTLHLEGDEYDTVGASGNVLSLIPGEKGSYHISQYNLSSGDWVYIDCENYDKMCLKFQEINPDECILAKDEDLGAEAQGFLDQIAGLSSYYLFCGSESMEKFHSHIGNHVMSDLAVADVKRAEKSCALLYTHLSGVKVLGDNISAKISLPQSSEYLSLDHSTIRNLDLVYNLATSSSEHGTLFGTLDHTSTRVGKEELYKQILHPLQKKEEILKRQKFINAIMSDPIMMEKIKTELKKIGNLKAILSRISLERATHKDLIQLKKSLIAIREIQKLLFKSQDPLLQKIFTSAS